MKAAQEMAVELLRRQKQRETNTKRDKLEAQKIGRRFVWQATSFTGYRERHKTQRGNIDFKTHIDD